MMISMRLFNQISSFYLRTNKCGSDVHAPEYTAKEQGWDTDPLTVS